MTKADIRLVLVVFAAAMLILFAVYMNRTQGSYAAVSYDGTVLMEIPLAQTDERYYLITEDKYVEDISAQSTEDVSVEYLSVKDVENVSVHITELSKEEWENIKLPAEEYNAIMYRDGKVSMIAANCPDKVCVHHIAVSSAGESIICLPHRLVIEIIGGDGQELDGVAY